MIRPVSFSSLDLYSKCPKSYYYRYIIREKIGIPDFTGTLPGNVVHNLAEKFFTNWIENKKADYNIFYNYFNETLEKYANSGSIRLGPDAFAPNIQVAGSLIKNWMLNFMDMIEAHGLLKNYVVVEHRFGHYKNPLKITNKLHLMGGQDYFGSVSKSTPGILADWKASDHTFHINNRQLYLYAMGLNKQLGLEISMAGFFLFKSREVVWTRVSKERVDDTIAWAESIVDNIESKKFEATPSSNACRMCDFRLQCPQSSFIIVKDASMKRAKNLTDDDIIEQESIEL